MQSPQKLQLEAIYLALQSIPAGKVIAYGQLAQLAGRPGAARQIGKVLSNLPENTELPWHRVVNAQGRISLPIASAGYALQHKRLAAEGVEVIAGKINLQRFGWRLD